MGHPVVMFLGTLTGVIVGAVGVNILMGNFKGNKPN
jgi:hypothetical protein